MSNALSAWISTELIALLPQIPSDAGQETWKSSNLNSKHRIQIVRVLSVEPTRRVEVSDGAVKMDCELDQEIAINYEEYVYFSGFR